MKPVLLSIFMTVATSMAPPMSFAGFPDAHESPPNGWTGHVFKLSQDYPAAPPPPEALPWKNFDFKTQPLDYVKAVLAYAYEGNIEVDWDGAKNAVRKWYHAPWMHHGRNGREFIRGLTAERVSRPRELHQSQASPVQNWAVSLYNPAGGHVIGKVWANETAPDAAAAVFPDGTVAIKLLFTAATTRQVPYLRESVRWQANIHRTIGSTAREVRTLRLLQIDVAVRDSRADTTTGWVFGTFVYDNTASGTRPWDQMIPVGVMWGNDPGLTPEEVAAGNPLKETFINPAIPASHPRHLGWAGRLNGPVDNPVSSCLSCHSTSQIPQVAQRPPQNASTTARLRWFRNIPAGQPFEEGGQSLDYSLQLTMGILNSQETQLQDAAMAQDAPPIINRE